MLAGRKAPWTRKIPRISRSPSLTPPTSVSWIISPRTAQISYWPDTPTAASCASRATAPLSATAIYQPGGPKDSTTGKAGGTRRRLMFPAASAPPASPRSASPAGRRPWCWSFGRKLSVELKVGAKLAAYRTNHSEHWPAQNS